MEDPAQRPAWLHALFFVTRQSGDDRPLRDLAGGLRGRLEPIYIALINTELAIRQGGTSDVIPGLTRELPADAGSYGPYFQVSRLIALSRPAEAVATLDRYKSSRRIAEADEFRLRLELLAALGRQDLLRARLEQGTINARELELVCTHLVRHPDSGALAALAQCLERSKLPPDAQTFGAYTAYFVACGIAGDWDRLHAAASRLKEISGSRLVQLGAVEAFFKREAGASRIETVLPALPTLSLEMIYALYDRYNKPAQPAVSVRIPHSP
jgi:hypothetical protein